MLKDTVKALWKCTGLGQTRLRVTSPGTVFCAGIPSPHSWTAAAQTISWFSHTFLVNRGLRPCCQILWVSWLRLFSWFPFYLEENPKVSISCELLPALVPAPFPVLLLAVLCDDWRLPVKWSMNPTPMTFSHFLNVRRTRNNYSILGNCCVPAPVLDPFM